MAINAQGWVAGWSNQPDGTRRAVLWKDGSLIADRHARRAQQHRAVARTQRRGHGRRHLPDRRVGPAGRGLELRAGRLPARDHRPHLPRVRLGERCDAGAARARRPSQLRAPASTTGATWSAGRRRRCTIRPASDAQVLQFRAVLWDPKDGSKGKIKARELPPFGDDSTSAATAINDEGQAVGISGDCDQAVGRFSAQHAVLWEQERQGDRDPQPGRHDLAHADGHQRPGRRRRVLQPARRRRSRGRLHLARLPLGLRRGHGRRPRDA